MDKNEFLPCWPKEWFSDFLKILRPDHISIHPETGNLYHLLADILNISENQIVFTAGSDLAIKAVFEVFIEPGDEVIVPSPTFAMYYIYTELYRAHLVEIHYDEDLNLNIADLIRAINEKTKLIAIANPNSPTGTVLGKSSLMEIIEAASEYGAAVLIDEAYYPFYQDSIVDMIDNLDNLIVTRTLSKAAGMGGMRTGYAISNKEIAQLIFAVKPMYEITTLSVILTEYVLSHYERIFDYAERVREGKKYLEDYFRSKGFDVYPGYANFMHVDFGEQKKKIVSHLTDKKVLFKDYFEHPSLKRFSRFTVGPKDFLVEFTKIFDELYNF